MIFVGFIWGTCPWEWLGVYHAAMIPPKQSTGGTEKEDGEGKDTKLGMMKLGGIGNELPTIFVGEIRPTNVTFQVTCLLISLQVH